MVTLRGFASCVNVSASLLSLIENDRHMPDKELVCRMASQLGEDADRWCAAIGKITPTAEKSIAKLVMEDPVVFRRLVGKECHEQS